MTTCVVVKKDGEVAIAADSLVTFGDTRLARGYEQNQKIFQVGESLIALAGTTAHFPVMRSLLAGLADECRLGTRDDVFRTFLKVHEKLKDEYFVNTKEFPTEALVGEHPALGSAALEVSGLVGGSYQISKGDSEDAESDDSLTDNTDPNSYTWALGEPNKGKAISLNLHAPSAPLKVGDKFFVDVHLENPMGVRFDGLNIVIDFDTNALRVEDCDHGNWIEIGANILDGPYHKEFPFDVHYRNEAFNELGQIHYMVATSKLGYRYPTGKLASILFTAVAPTPKAEIKFHIAADPIDNGVMATVLGQTVLAEDNKGLQDTLVRIST